MDRPRKVTSQMATKMSHVIGCPYYETCSNPFVSKADLFMTDPKKLLTPSEILSKLILEKSRRSLNTVHRDLLKNSSSSKPPEKFSEENLTNMNRSSSKLQGMSVPSLIEELKEKWSKPIDKLPVYIDFPRLAMKVEVIVGEKHQIVKQNQSINPNILKLLSSSPPDFPTASPPSQRLDNKATESKLSSSDDLMKKVDKKLKKSKEKKEKKEKKKKKDDELEITLESRVKVLEKSEWGAGAVRFIGNCKLGSGKWMGIELESPSKFLFSFFFFNLISHFQKMEIAMEL